MTLDGTNVRSVDATLSLEQAKIIADKLLHDMVTNYAEHYMRGDDIPEDEYNRFFEFLDTNRHYNATGSELLAAQVRSQFTVLQRHFFRQERLTEKQSKRE